MPTATAASATRVTRAATRRRAHRRPRPCRVTGLAPGSALGGVLACMLFLPLAFDFCGQVLGGVRHIAGTRGASPGAPAAAPRSEEHTSELQSRENLVCRLLLEKKNADS